MSFDALKGLSSTELRAKLKQLSEENFHAKFTTEAATPARGAEIRKRRREIAQILTVGEGRKALVRLQDEKKALDERLEGVIAVEKPGVPEHNAARKTRDRLAEVRRGIQELGRLEKK